MHPWICDLLFVDTLAIFSSVIVSTSLLSSCLCKRQGYVLVKDANIEPVQDLPQKSTPKPPEGWGDRNDDTLKNVKTLTRSESTTPRLQRNSSGNPAEHNDAQKSASGKKSNENESKNNSNDKKDEVKN
ncbi:unnamed protein product [Anisakis simplex]|uniref:Uncharacterized protein n=1 Tax=Anisakis simplex TaxID=6269 RepID=A0A0M3KA39_ANISI|nr:unnamed protein product [Anisakis simplex]